MAIFVFAKVLSLTVKNLLRFLQFGIIKRKKNNNLHAEITRKIFLLHALISFTHALFCQCMNALMLHFFLAVSKLVLYRQSNSFVII